MQVSGQRHHSPYPLPAALLDVHSLLTSFSFFFFLMQQKLLESMLCLETECAEETWLVPCLSPQVTETLPIRRSPLPPSSHPILQLSTTMGQVNIQQSRGEPESPRRKSSNLGSHQTAFREGYTRSLHVKANSNSLKFVLSWLQRAG